MMHLKRASAGSGKTYALAKTFIRLLISYKKDERRVLRPAPEIREVLPSIMAVTFTNKATDEMKQRIVSNLSALARADKISDPEKLNDVDYLNDFMKEFNAEKDAIAEVARAALRALLLHYSDFKVSTIDSFFQGILHTFAYESDLEDAFNVEIDSDYISTMGLNAVLDTIASAKADGKTDPLGWFREIMDDKTGSSSWNIFQRSWGKNSGYSDIVKWAGELDKESFKTIRKSIEDYFDNLEVPFTTIVRDFEKANLSHWEEMHKKRQEIALELEDAYMALGYSPADGANSVGSLIEKLKKNLNYQDLCFNKKSVKIPPEKPGAAFKSGVQTTKIIKGNTRNLDGFPKDDPRIMEIDALYRDLYSFNKQFSLEEKKIKTYFLYRKMLPFFVIILEVARRKKEYLEDTNSLAISETNTVLQKIIGGSDTPFIYERMGSILNHYLIDEFQDTSRMQWENFLPLLNDSDSRGKDNLIIGDAKQSIYRFRNADYRLIQNDVPRAFPLLVPSAEDREKSREEENTNYRSHKKIVGFNNFLFNEIASRESVDGISITPEIRDIYKDCVQHFPSKKKSDLGYVELDLYQPLSSEDKENDDAEGFLSLAEPGLKSLPAKIKEIVSRGYSYDDIGILVRTNSQGNAVVQVISDYNALHPDDQIPMVSEESLLVKRAASIGIVIHALRKIVGRDDDKRVRKEKKWKDPVDRDELFAVLHDMKAMVLPAITESLLEKFVPEALRNKEAPFIAAFQDAVLDYTAVNPGDIGSFLRWWDRKADSLAITNPEEAEGVRIVTVHKSKGLEYKCVILPYADFHFTPSRVDKEWVWISPDESLLKAETLPPYIPLSTGKSLRESLHAAGDSEFNQALVLDALNAMYVAFTRARNELYVYAPLAASGRPGRILKEIFDKPDIDTSVPDLLTEAPVVEEDDNGNILITYGLPLSKEEVEEEIRKKKEKEEKSRDIPAPKVMTLERYIVSPDRNHLVFSDGETSPMELADEMDQEADSEENDPRSEGNLKHRILEEVIVEADLPKAVKKMRVKGLITRKEGDVWGELLKDALAEVRDYGWFDPENKVYNERSIIQYREKTQRPDRLIVRPDGTAVIIDYKFGKPKSEYREQVGRYLKSALGSGLFRSVKAYLWYVGEKVEEVTVMK